MDAGEGCLMATPRFFGQRPLAVGRFLSVGGDELGRAVGTMCIGVRCGPETRPGSNEALTAELFVNLAARWYPALHVEGPADVLARLKDLALAINPRIDLSAQTPTRSVCVGTAAGSPEDVRAWSSGWVAGIAPGDAPARPTGPFNVYAAATAACLSAAEMFRILFASATWSAVQVRTWSLLVHRQGETGIDEELAAVDLGDIALVGIGAVGSAATWVLARHAGAVGRVFAIDEEPIELTNLQRYVLPMDADEHADKVDLAEREFRGTSLDCVRVKMTLADAAAQLLTEAVPTFAVSVDNAAGRRAAQLLLPRLLINAWTSDAGLGVSWHTFDGKRACAACLYHPLSAGKSTIERMADAFGLAPKRAAELWQGNQPLTAAEVDEVGRRYGADETTKAGWRVVPVQRLYSEVACGMAPVKLHGVDQIRTVPLAFQSVLSGVLMAAEMVKRLDPHLAGRAQAEIGVTWGNILRPLPGTLVEDVTAAAGCYCCDRDYRAVADARWGGQPEISNDAATASEDSSAQTP